MSVVYLSGMRVERTKSIMNDKPFDINEFIESSSVEEPKEEKIDNPTENTETSEEIQSTDETKEVVEEAPELDVQKAVVESLAADKIELNEKLNESVSAINLKDDEINKLKGVLAEKESEIENLKKIIAGLESRNKELDNALAHEKGREIDLQERNPNSLALLDRDVELPDRFPGETRDQVLEVIKQARDQAEAEGRLRRAQVLEGVLVANEPNGNLAKKRAALEKFFKDNGNIVTGIVLEELKRCNIPYKKGETYLLPSEIMRQTY